MKSLCFLSLVIIGVGCSHQKNFVRTPASQGSSLLKAELSAGQNDPAYIEPCEKKGFAGRDSWLIVMDARRMTSHGVAKIIELTMYNDFSIVSTKRTYLPDVNKQSEDLLSISFKFDASNGESDAAEKTLVLDYISRMPLNSFMCNFEDLKMGHK